MTFAEKLRQLRDAAGLTQEQMAERSSINLWTIRGYEQGRREPNWKGVLSLAKALDVAAEVFSECDESTPEEQSARTRGRPRKPEAPADFGAAHSQREEMPPSQSKPRDRKTRKPRGG
jgi:transcriptional regulator with XRE-family HTH domain